MTSEMGCPVYDVSPFYHSLGAIFILAGLFMTICG